MYSNPQPAQPSASSNFHLSFFFLPQSKKSAMFNFYQFCRLADDIVDECDGSAEGKIKAKAELQELANEVELAFCGKPRMDVGHQLKSVVEAFKISKVHCLDIIRGCEMDLFKNRYSNFEELYEYCYCVASCVGLVSLSIFGCEEEVGRDFAINLGLAFQLTNILRDVREDFSRDRIYLPQEDLQRFHVSNEDLSKAKADGHFIEMMQFECARALSFYQKAESSFPRNQGKNLIAAQIMKEVYFEILKEVSQNPARVLTERVSISKPRKLYLAMLGFLTTAVRS